MLMVIFGAGASYDSAQAFPLPEHELRAKGATTSSGMPADPGAPWRPPLADDLFRDTNRAFGDIVGRYPKLPHILPFLRQPSGGRSVEEELELLQSYGGAERKREFASVVYYLRDLLFEVSDKWRDMTSGVTNYAPLIGEILNLSKDEDPICLVSFNYDLLLDRALISFNLEPQGLEPEYYFLHPRLKLFKPHGSVNWARFVEPNHDTHLTPVQFCERADMIRLTDEFILVPSANEANKFPQDRTVFPCLAVPVQNKAEDTFAWPASHQTHFVELLSRVTKILIIGWRAREAHFIKLLRDSLPKVSRVMVIGNGPVDAAGTLQHFAESTSLVKKADIDLAEVGKNIFSFRRDRNLSCMPYEGAIELSVAPGGFSDFVLNRRLVDFLK